MKAYKPLSKHQQRGAFSILGGASILVALSVLALVLDTGRLHFEQRNLQKVADMAALESVSRLETGACFAEPDNAQAFAVENAERNKFTVSDSKSIKVNCATVDSSTGIRVVTASAGGAAVQVIASNTVATSLIVQTGSLFNSNLNPKTTLSASATAQKQEPSAAFSVGSELLRLEDKALLGTLLRTIGLSADNLSVLNSRGLVDAKITPSGLLRALGVKAGIDELRALSPEGLLDLTNTQVGALGIERLIEVSAGLITDKTLAADVKALARIVRANADLDKVKLDLFKVPGLINADGSPNRGLISLHTGKDGTLASALDTNIDLGTLLKTSLLIGSSGRGLEIPELNALGLARVKLGIVEPPSIAAGPVGITAYNAQIRAYIHLDTSKLLGGLLKPILESFLGIRVNLPITLDLTTGYGVLDKISCSAEEPTVDISVTSHVLNTCVGKISEENIWSGSKSCDHYVEEDELIRLLHQPILSGSTFIPALTQFDDTTVVDKPVGGPYTTVANNLNLGDSVDGIVTGLLNLLGGVFREPSPIGFNIDKLNPKNLAEKDRIKYLAKQYLEDSKKNGFYDVDKVSNLVVNGGTFINKDGVEVTLAPLDSKTPDWAIPHGIPTTCLLGVCPPNTWKPGTFSSSFKAYNDEVYSVLDLLGISTLGNGYTSCSGLLTATLARNKCIEGNLNNILLKKPGGSPLEVSDEDINNLANLNSDNVTCSGALCVMLKPILNLLKPLLNGIGHLLKVLISDVLGLELGRTDVKVLEISCGTPRLVN